MNGKTRIIAAFCFSICILVLIGIYAYRSTNQYKNSSDWVNHTQNVISEAQVILVEIQSVETSQRGYVITGESRYLEPFDRAVLSSGNSYRNLRKSIIDNPGQLTLLDSIHSHIDTKIRFAKTAVDLRKKRGFESAQGLIATGLGENLMREIRTLVNDFISNERKLLTNRLALAEKSFLFARKVIILSIAITIAIVVITLFFFIKDYNIRIRSERKVIESEYRIKKFLESLPLGVYVIDNDGKPYFTNEKYEEFLGKGIIKAESPDKIQEIYRTYITGTNTLYPAEKLPIVRALNGEKNICAEDMEVEKNGVRIPLRINATNVTNVDDQPEFAIAVYEDISDIKEAEKKLKEAKKLAEESATLKEAFLANMSHEIRTPMNAILGFTDLLLKSKLEGQGNSYAQTIKTSAENLLRIINDVLDISKIASGMMSFETHPLSIKQLFSSVEVMLLPKAGEKNLSLHFSCSNDMPDVLLGDPTRLTQIIINLVGNAIKFTNSGGVEVHAGILEKNEDEYRIGFSVKDTGIGIPGDKLTSIFGRFTQAESHTARHYGGTGLGLNIVKQLVELQGGTVHVNSEVNKGSEFIFNLPFKRSDETALPEKKPEFNRNAKDLHAKSILLVEDNPVNVKYIQSLFEAYEIVPDLAENGKIAVEKVKAKKYDVVLMDIEMPEMNGYEATSLIRNELKSSVPIIAMTAHAMAGEKEKCLSLGMNDYLSKPVRENDLMAKLSGFTADIPTKAISLDESPSLLNMDFLLTAMGDRKDVIRETIDIALEQLPEDFAILDKSVSDADYETIRRFSHRMKSSVSLMGITRVESLLKEMEQMAVKKEPMAQIELLHEKLLVLYEKAIEEIKTERTKYI